jgi:hypothetical protein
LLVPGFCSLSAEIRGRCSWRMLFAGTWSWLSLHRPERNLLSPGFDK